MSKNGRERLVVNNPYNKEVVGEVGLLSRDAVLKMINICAEYKSSLTRHERSSILLKASQILKTRAKEAARLITSESGLCIKDTEYEIQRVINILEIGSQLTNTFMFDHMYHADNIPDAPRKRIIASYEPLSLIVAITPFNHPMNQVAHKVIPAIATDNQIIVKPSLKTPLSAIYFRDLLYESGLPEQMFKIALCKNELVTSELITNKSVELVAFTGSNEVGSIISGSCSLKRLVLELGGCDPLIVLEDADLSLAVTLTVKGAFQNTGQRCTAIKRVLVSNKIADNFLKKLVKETRKIKYGDPYDKRNDMGSLINEEAALAIHDKVTDSIRSGAILEYGNILNGAILSPTILDHVPLDHNIVNEEIFGPVVPIIRFNDIDEAVSISNSSKYALSAGVVTNDLHLATYFIKNLKTGMININDVPSFRSESAPFGGVKGSGIGIKEGLVESMRNYQNIKVFSFPW